MTPDLSASQLLREVIDKGLIYWEPQTARGYVAKADMIARCEKVLAASAAKSEPAPVAVDVAEVERLVDLYVSAAQRLWHGMSNDAGSWDDARKRERAATASREALLTAIRQLASSAPDRVPAELRKAERLGMTQGILLACTTILRTFDQPTVAQQILSEAGITEDEVIKSGLGDFDIEASLPIVRELAESHARIAAALGQETAGADTGWLS